MSSGGKGATETSSRVSIPGSVKKTIENIKEITDQSHSDDEIYAMLKECSMDPNETAQKLLVLDTFHEVKRKHNRRKENLNKESADLRWKPGVQARANKGGRGNYSSRYGSYDAGSGRNYAVVKENSTTQISEKGVSSPPLPTSQERKRIEASVVSPVIALSNGPSGMSSTRVLHETHATASKGVNESDASGDASIGKVEELLPLPSPIDSTKNYDVAHGIRAHQMLKSSNSSTPILSATSSGDNFTSSDPVLLPSEHIKPPSAISTIRHQMDSEASVGSSIVPQMPNMFHGVGKNQLLEARKTASSTHDGSFSSMPSSNHNNRTHVIGPQKVGPGKEWKPKSTNPSIVQGASTAASPEVSIVVEKHSELRPTPKVLSSKDVTLDLQRKLEETRILDSQHVIIPNHLHIPDAEKLGFCFGSFNASFELDMSSNCGHESDKSQLLSESPESIEETVKEPSPSQNELVTAEDTEAKYSDNPPTLQGPENFSSTEGDVSSSVLPEYNESKQDVPPGSHQHTVAQSSSSYGFSFVPPILSSRVSPLDSSESQARDASQVPNFVIQQSFDPTSYYLQFYRPGAHGDGRISPFHSAGAASKYNGNANMLSALTSQSPQEGGAPMVLSTAAPTPIVTQVAGVLQNSQQTQSVFRQPTGMHLPHYPPNYIPYNPYLSPYYVPPPAVHQFLSNGTFPQQPQAGSIYPTPPGATAKYSVSQFKQGPNIGNSTYMGVPGSWPYILSTANYTSSSATRAVTSTSNEDLAAHQVKENSLYVNGQQSEGSAVWFTAPSQDISSLQASSFYDLPQGQLAFTPTQPGPGTFAGMYHPAQAITAATVHPLLQQSQTISSAIDMVRPPSSVYQQPQHTQLNWSSSY